MKLIAILLFVLSLSAAEITIIVKNDAGKILDTVTITTTNAALQSIESYRQQLSDASSNNGVRDPNYESRQAFMRWILRSKLSEALEAFPTAAMQSERDKKAAAQAAEQAAKEGALQ